MRNLAIFTTLIYSHPSILRSQGILRNLSNMYDGLFSIEPCATMFSANIRLDEDALKTS